MICLKFCYVMYFMSVSGREASKMSARAKRRPSTSRDYREGPKPEKTRRTSSSQKVEEKKPQPRAEVMAKHPGVPVAVIRPRHVEDPEGRADVQRLRRFIHSQTRASRELEDELIKTLIEAIPHPGQPSEARLQDMEREIARLLRAHYRRW